MDKEYGKVHKGKGLSGEKGHDVVQTKKTGVGGGWE